MKTKVSCIKRLWVGFVLVLQVQAAPPNVLFIIKDDQHYDTIHALGNSEVATPTLDTLVAEGVSFRNAYIMGGNAGAVCLPSRAMFNTGRGLFNLSKNKEQISAQDALLGETFRKAGYATYGIGKWHNGKEAFYRSFAAGGPILFGGMSQQFNPPVQEFDESGGTKKGRKANDASGPHSSALYADAAVKLLSGHDAGQPFFMYLSFQSPHDPRTAPARYHAMYQPEKLTLPANYLPEHPFRIGDDRIRDEKLAPFPRTPDVVRQHLADYYAMVTHDDDQIGRVIQVLKERGLYENTIIVFTADNGLAIGQHGLFGKQNVYDCSTHIPLVLAGPGIPKGESREALCYSIDLFPTLCDLAALPTPQTVEGKSLKPAISNPKEPHRATLIHAYRDFCRALRTPQWKLIHSTYENEQHVQLFDLNKDPKEANDLGNNPEFSALITQLTAQLQQELKAVGDDAQLNQPSFGRVANKESR